MTDENVRFECDRLVCELTEARRKFYDLSEMLESAGPGKVRTDPTVTIWSRRVLEAE